MFDPPDQLRVRTDLDGLHIKVSGRPRSVFDLFRSSRFQTAGWSVLVVLCLLAAAGNPLAAALAAVLILVLQGVPHLEPTRGAWESDLTLTPSHLMVERAGEIEQVPWTQVGLVSVEGRNRAVVHILRAGQDALDIPMELEPVEHAVWLAMTLQERAKEARKHLGSVADVPRAIRRLRT